MYSVTHRRFWTLIVTLGATATWLFSQGELSDPKWENVIRDFEASDAENPPKKGGIVFVGSSSIRGWESAPERFDAYGPIVMRGFGGSHLSDTVYFADRIVTPYEPKAVVIYAGDNDIANGKSARRVVDDFKKAVALIHEADPETKIVFLAIKASVKRWFLRIEMRRANEAIERICADDARLGFVDCWSNLLNAKGHPDPRLFQPDGLHLNRRGYRIWEADLDAELRRLGVEMD